MVRNSDSGRAGHPRLENADQEQQNERQHDEGDKYGAPWVTPRNGVVIIPAPVPEIGIVWVPRRGTDRRWHLRVTLLCQPYVNRFNSEGPTLPPGHSAC